MEQDGVQHENSLEGRKLMSTMHMPFDICLPSQDKNLVFSLAIKNSSLLLGRHLALLARHHHPIAIRK